MKILITGSSGMIGSALFKALVACGHEVKPLLRNNTITDAPYWEPEKNLINLNGFTGIDVVIHLAGDNIADGRWTSVKKDRILNSRINSTKLLSEFFSKADYKPELFVSASAIGFYGNSGDEIVDENSKPGKGFLSEVCQKWESSAEPAINAKIRVVNIRFGMVLSTSGGALKKMLLPFKMGLGGILGNGKQYISWISLIDAIEIIKFIISKDNIEGAVNLVAPTPVTNYQFTKTLGKSLDRPTLFPIPAFAVRLIFGEMGKELLLSSTRTAPKRVTDAGYNFIHSTLEEAFTEVL